MGVTYAAVNDDAPDADVPNVIHVVDGSTRYSNCDWISAASAGAIGVESSYVVGFMNVIVSAIRDVDATATMTASRNNTLFTMRLLFVGFPRID